MQPFRKKESMELLVDKNVKNTSEMSVSSSGQTIGEYAPRTYPQVIKYMGSKAQILDFIGEGLSAVSASGRPLVDLFAGACAITAGFGDRFKVVSNDIQEYSSIIASTYLKRAESIGNFDLVALASVIAERNISELPATMHYPATSSLTAFNKIEKSNRSLLLKEFDTSHHLFTRIYSGTWWSAEQCIWIDAIREVLDGLYKDGHILKADFNFGLTCLLHAMAYTSQGTGHYAQYRDAKTVDGMADINKYRRTSVPVIFRRKFDSLLAWHSKHVVDLGHELVALDYRKCLEKIEKSVVYADPPYAFVHYSRFYHAMETLVRYDYPELQFMRDSIVKGRYRVDRHQSPFCIKTQVHGAFVDMFEGVKDSKSDLLLSYSNTGMIDIDELIGLASNIFGRGYRVWFEEMDHMHMTMGRSKDRSRKVMESLIIAKKR